MKKVKLILSYVVMSVFAFEIISLSIVAAYSAYDNETNTDVVLSSSNEEDEVAVNNDFTINDNNDVVLTSTITCNVGYIPTINVDEIVLTYRCNSTDTLKSISNTFYDDEKYYLYLAKYNGIDCRSSLYDGQVLNVKLIPEEDVQQQALIEENERIAEEERKRKEQEEKGTYLGNFKITFYTPDPGENGGSTKTATGESLVAKVGKEVAVDTRVITLGSTV